MLSPLEFPRLAAHGYTKTSDATPAYNCIAWAANDTTRFWWPAPSGYWPPKAPRQLRIKAFVLAFQTLGYKKCRDGLPEPSYEKVAIYADNMKATHAARQLPDGAWTHKMGRNIDIVTNLDAVSGGNYGEVVRFLRRPRP
jgi:hypothetical protein